MSKNPNQINKVLSGAYEVSISSHDNKVTLVASGSELELAMSTQQELSGVGIESKVVSMPCQELFDKQNEEYKNKIIEPNKLIVSIEAGSIMCWKKYLKNEDLAIGLDGFGKSAPYKKIYDAMGLNIK